MMYFDRSRVISKQFGKICFDPAGENRFLAAGKFGSIEVKEMYTDEFTVYELSMDIKENLDLSTSSQPGVWMTMSLTNKLAFFAEGRHQTLEMGQFNFFFYPQASVSYKFSTGKFAILSVYFDKAYLKKLEQLQSGTHDPADAYKFIFDGKGWN